jgi:hypothetical protein
MMKKLNSRWWLAVVAVCCLSPVAAVGHDHRPDGCDPRWQNCVVTPEGGSNAFYLLGAGFTCFGAMLLRSRTMKQTQS